MYAYDCLCDFNIYIYLYVCLHIHTIFRTWYFNVFHICFVVHLVLVPFFAPNYLAFETPVVCQKDSPFLRLLKDGLPSFRAMLPWKSNHHFFVGFIIFQKEAPFFKWLLTSRVMLVFVGIFENQVKHV